jgi:hypothetical protein
MREKQRAASCSAAAGSWPQGNFDVAWEWRQGALLCCAGGRARSAQAKLAVWSRHAQCSGIPQLPTRTFFLTHRIPAVKGFRKITRGATFESRLPGTAPARRHVGPPPAPATSRRRRKIPTPCRALANASICHLPSKFCARSAAECDHMSIARSSSSVWSYSISSLMLLGLRKRPLQKRKAQTVGSRRPAGPLAPTDGATSVEPDPLALTRSIPLKLAPDRADLTSPALLRGATNPRRDPARSSSGRALAAARTLHAASSL